MNGHCALIILGLLTSWIDALGKRNASSIDSIERDALFGAGKRNKLEIIFELLEACKEPRKKTHLIYRTQISYYQLSSYLEILLKFRMIEEISMPFSGFRITDKGRTLLQLFSYR